LIRTQLTSDKLAAGLSMACVIHCFFAPSLIILSYSFLSFSVESEFVHYIIIMIAVPISLLALGLGYKNHKILSFLLSGIFGLSLLILAVVLGEAMLGEIGERTLTLVGSLIVAYSHFMNHRVCKKLECDCHEI
tara:strand:+ start:309 stop:710 length:402 start_codon:yes stop_codon:yes gene_type:complete